MTNFLTRVTRTITSSYGLTNPRLRSVGPKSKVEGVSDGDYRNPYNKFENAESKEMSLYFYNCYYGSRTPTLLLIY